MDFDKFNDEIIVTILNNFAKDDDIDIFINQINAVRFLNGIIKAGLNSGSTYYIDLMETSVWLKIILTMGILPFTSTKRNKIWSQQVINYFKETIEEGLYTNRVHDLLLMPSLSAKNLVKMLILKGDAVEAILTMSKNDITMRTYIQNYFINNRGLRPGRWMYMNYDDLLIENDFLNGNLNYDEFVFNNLTTLKNGIETNELLRFIKYFNVNNVTNMKSLFKYFRNYNHTIDLTYWNTSKVTNMSKMFKGVRSQIIGVKFLNTSNVTNMESMFEDAYSFNQPIKWSVKKVTDMTYMFHRARSFNQSLNLDTSDKLQYITSMFQNATSFNQELTLYIPNVKSTEDMFKNATSFNSVIHINTTNVHEMENMFHGATSFNQPLDHFDTKNVESMAGMFKNAISFNQPLDHFVTSNVERMTNLFSNAIKFNQNLNKWDTSKVIVMDSMFKNATSFNKPLDNFDTTNVYLMDDMFHGATSFNQPLDHFDTKNVESMDGMFKNAISFNQPLDYFVTNNVESMKGMFSNAIKFNQNLNKWDTSKVINMESMFENAFQFNNGDERIHTELNWQEKEISNIDNFFWNTSNVINMKRMFFNTPNFRKKLLWDTTSVHAYDVDEKFDKITNRFAIRDKTGYNDMFTNSGYFIIKGNIYQSGLYRDKPKLHNAVTKALNRVVDDVVPNASIPFVTDRIEWCNQQQKKLVPLFLGNISTQSNCVCGCHYT